MCKYILSLLIVAAAMLLATSGLQAGVYVELVDTTGAEIFDSIPIGEPVTFVVKMDNDLGENVTGFSIGLRMYSPTGAVWQTPTSSAGPDLATYFDAGVFLNEYGVDGTNDDTIAIGAVAISSPGVRTAILVWS